MRSLQRGLLGQLSVEFGLPRGLPGERAPGFRRDAAGGGL